MSGYFSFSIDDSSCGVLGICYDLVVAYVLGLSKVAWLEIAVIVRRRGRLCIDLVRENSIDSWFKLLVVFAENCSTTAIVEN